MGFFRVMSIYTTSDRDNVKNAIIDLATGKRVVQVDVAGKTREFHSTNIKAMRALLEEIQADLASSSEISGARRVSTTIASDTW